MSHPIYTAVILDDAGCFASEVWREYGRDNAELARRALAHFAQAFPMAHFEDGSGAKLDDQSQPLLPSPDQDNWEVNAGYGLREVWINVSRIDLTC